MSDEAKVSGEQPPIGIDLGTTFSVIAYLDGRGCPLTIPNRAGELTTPSAVLFHDGRPLTADDVVASFKRVRVDIGLTVATYLDAVADVRKAPGGSNAVEIVTHTPSPQLLTRLSMVAIAPQYFDPQRPLGTGPYRWVAGRERGGIILKRWERYWDDRPEMDEVQIGFVGGEDKLAEAVRSGRFDVIAGVPIEYLRLHQADGDWQVVKAPYLGTTLLGFNVQRAPLSDRRVREAIDVALDRPELLGRVFPDRGALLATSLLPPGVPGRPEDAPASGPADRPRARALLSAAGVAPGTRVRLAVLGLDRMVVAEVARQLGEVGLAVDTAVEPFDASYRKIMGGHTELFVIGWSFRFGDPADFLESVVHSRQDERRLGLMNGSGFASEAADRLIEQATRLGEPAQRIDLLRRALAIVAQERPYVPLFHSERFALIRSPFVVDARSGLWILPQEVHVAR